MVNKRNDNKLDFCQLATRKVGTLQLTQLGIVSGFEVF